MLFQSNEFLFMFLPCVWLVVLLLRKTAPGTIISWLVMASFIFYSWYKPVYGLLLAASIIFNYLLSIQLYKNRSKWLLFFGVTINLLLLAVFKYTDLLINTVNTVSGEELLPLQHIILPIAISFFTFQQIAYLVDCKNGVVKEFVFSKYALFICFFPQFIAGPIVHHSDVIWQFDKLAKSIGKPSHLAVGSAIFIIGFIKKVFIADSMANYSDAILLHAENPDLIVAWIGAVAYSMRIYFDFSGYSDMAIGLARMFGIVLPVNFLSPYKASNIIDFWRRWHITLSRFLKDYFYIPLGGNRQGELRRLGNIMIVMIVGGLWHGAAWAFAVWGMMHGTYLVINHIWVSRIDIRMPEPVGLLLTNIAVIFAWVPFTVTDFGRTLDVWRGMVGLNGIILPEPAQGFLNSELFVYSNSVFRDLYLTGGGLTGALIFISALIICYLMPNVYECMRKFNPILEMGRLKEKFNPFKFLFIPNAVTASILVFLFYAAIIKNATNVEFLYFQF